MKTVTVVLLIAAGFIWVVLTLFLKNSIKKLWLYTIFPTAIFSAPLIVSSVRENNVALLVLLGAVYAYMCIRAYKGFGVYTATFIPLLVISLNAIYALVYG